MAEPGTRVPLGALVALLERRVWARRLEWARLLAVVAVFGVVFIVPI